MSGGSVRVASTVDEVLVPHFDTKYIARSILGHYSRQATPEQLGKFEDAFKNMLVRGYAEQEKNLQKTLMSAQKLADDMRAGAEENALRIVRDAEHRSRLLLDKTQARVEDVQRDIDGLKLRKRDIEATLEASIQALRNTLDFVRDQDDRDEKLLTYRPRHADPEARVG